LRELQVCAGSLDDLTVLNSQEFLQKTVDDVWTVSLVSAGSLMASQVVAEIMPAPNGGSLIGNGLIQFAGVLMTTRAPKQIQPPADSPPMHHDPHPA